ncbi:MAG: hypothetical protein LBI64_01270 [Coriobacteriales bacterium]|jgi:O-antigen/teichoic acid export membrane protein|nr:hypothetical protein [Coriobacteriales bacterium]
MSRAAIQKIPSKRVGVIWNALGSTTYAANSFIMLIAVSQLASIEEVGYYGIAYTIGYLLHVLGGLGAERLQMTDYKGRFAFADYLWLRIVACAIAAVICLGLALQESDLWLKVFFIIVLSAYYLIVCMGELYQAAAIRLERLDLSGQAVFFRTLISTAGFCLVLFLTRRVELAMLAMFALCLLAYLYFNMHRMKGLVDPARAFNFANIKKLIGECLPLFGSLILSNLILSSSRFVIEYSMDSTAQGYFTQIFLPVFAINMISNFFLIPSLSDYGRFLESGDMHAFWRRVFRQVTIVATITLCSLLLAYFAGIPILNLVYGGDIAAYKTELLLIIAGGGILAITTLLQYLLIILRLQSRLLLVYALVVILSFGIALGLIGSLGLLGASLAFIASYLILLLGFLGILLSALRTRVKERSAS